MNEKRSGRAGTIGAKPEVGGEGKTMITGTEIFFEEKERVDGASVMLDDDNVTFKKLIGFMTGQKEMVIVVG